MPFVVVTRSSEKLMENLLRDKHPILFEGLHCCFHLNDPRLNERTKIVRMHNIEHDYYFNLEKVEKSIFKNAFDNMFDNIHYPYTNSVSYKSNTRVV